MSDNRKCGQCGGGFVMGDDMWYCPTCYVRPLSPDEIRGLQAAHAEEVARLRAENKSLLEANEIEVAESMPQHVERMELRAEVDALKAAVGYYENMLCVGRILARPEGPVQAIEPERVGQVLRERDDLRAQLTRLQSEKSAAVEVLRGDDPPVKPDPDPLLSIRKSRLEYVVRDVVRDAYSGGIEFALRKPPLKHEDAEARWDLLVARALTDHRTDQGARMTTPNNPRISSVATSCGDALASAVEAFLRDERGAYDEMKRLVATYRASQVGERVRLAVRRRGAGYYAIMPTTRKAGEPLCYVEFTIPPSAEPVVVEGEIDG